MQSVFLNGGMIGVTLDYGSTEQYIIGTNQQRVRPTLVGQQVYNRSGSTTALNISFNLSGGTGTLPQTGDIVILAIALGAGTTTLMSAPSGYTQLARFAASDTNDSVLYVGYQIMGSTPDTTFPVPSSLSTSNSQMVIVSVWRGVDQTTPIDVSTATATGTNSRLADPPAITPVTENAIIIGIGATAYAGTVYSFSAGGSLSSFVSISGSDTYDGALGLGHHEWVSSTFDPTAFSITGTTSSDSWTAVTLTLRPALLDVPIYGNYKNSGVWGLPAVFEYYYVASVSPGQELFTTSTSWIVPAGVTQISAVTIGGGGGGGGGESGRDEGVTGGGGGGLAYGTFAVTPGETLTITVGLGGNGGGSGSDGSAGGTSSIARGATVLLGGGGGGAGRERSTSTVNGGSSSGTERTGGGTGGTSGGTTNTGGGGGGAAGYSGNGGNGGTSGSGTNGAGGGGGGGGATNAGQGYGGGGVGPYGEGASGTGGPLNSTGTGGSSGGDGSRPAGGPYGGGGGGCDDDTNGSGGNGHPGVVRIIWGNGRAYPSTDTGDI